MLPHLVLPLVGPLTDQENAALAAQLERVVRKHQSYFQDGVTLAASGCYLGRTHFHVGSGLQSEARV